MRAEVEIAPVRDPLQFAVVAGIEERERVLDVGRADRVVRQFLRCVISQPQVAAPYAMARVPAVPAVAPVLIPRPGLARMTEELHLHLLEFARAEREVPRRDF